MSRKEELENIFKDIDDNVKNIIYPLIEKIVFIEESLQKLEKLPFIQVHPSNPSKQRATPASKQYKELLQQYNNCLKTVLSVTNKKGDNEESPLRAWVKSRISENEK